MSTPASSLHLHRIQLSLTAKLTVHRGISQVARRTLKLCPRFTVASCKQVQRGVHECRMQPSLEMWSWPLVANRLLSFETTLPPTKRPSASSLKGSEALSVLAAACLISFVS